MEDAQKRSRIVLFEFLRDKANKNDLYFRFKRYAVLITKWQKEWRNRKAEDQRKIDSLSSMWDKERNIMREYYLLNQGTSKSIISATKKNKALAGKFLTMYDDIKLEIINKYFKKAKLEFTICFVENRLDLNPANFSPSIYQQLEDFKHQVKTLEKELYSGVKNDPILDWISAKQAALATSSSNADIMSVGSPTSSNGMFTSTVIHASVNKNALEKQAEKERKEKEEADKQAKAQA